MKILLILRHAKSSWKSGSTPDFDRPLNKRGKAAAPRMGELILKEGLTPDAILSSSARRAKDTAKAVAKACNFQGRVDLRDDLYLAEPKEYIAALRELKDEVDSAMVVGHNPGMETLAELLTGEDVTMPTAALAMLELPIDSWSELSRMTKAELKRFWKSKELESA